MADNGRFLVQTVVTTPKATEWKVQDLTEFLAACHRHGIGADSAITVVTDGTHHQLRAMKTLERTDG